jgi:hypothetical protein
MAIKTGDCRFPVADIIDFEFSAKRQVLYCGAPCVKGRSYCEEHMTVAYRKQTPRQSREDRALAKEALAAALKNSQEKESIC